ncbi:hypothetical protein CWB96_16255 [Pseudoalteromonas citrea]|uniref:Uncharacterized protein n=1 Tax=Pseudoalteromonas citrea TaxID=43655 RepID=A0A5S3XKX5_9GAMM|nr:hypothetical protein [Pseudoalteromonas citrea]TMP44651.1 hypothetical protein CWB97_06310 [Pseudoalteromonas citrea]TMP55818.1 hypothetical protein CWB96_16255 [Pseudoalteromonas citrea]
MKKTNVTVALFAALSATSSFASITNIYDIDGYERVTRYANGPIASSVITSELAHNLNVYLHSSTRTNGCNYANVYTEIEGTFVAHAHVTDVDSRYGIKQATALIPDEYVAVNKRLVASCDGENGEQYNVHAKVPAAPIIDWNMTVEPEVDSEFVRQTNSYSYHSAYKVQSTLRVENQSTDSYCQTVTDRGVYLGLFNGQGGASKFNSNVFFATKSVDNTQNTQPVVYQTVECQNAAGRTKAVKVFSLTDSAGIELIEEHIIYK